MKKIREILFRNMKQGRRSEVHPSLGRRGIVVPYDIPVLEGHICWYCLKSTDPRSWNQCRCSSRR
jgi:hypothetical protein